MKPWLGGIFFYSPLHADLRVIIILVPFLFSFVVELFLHCKYEVYAVYEHAHDAIGGSQQGSQELRAPSYPCIVAYSYSCTPVMSTTVELSPTFF